MAYLSYRTDGRSSEFEITAATTTIGRSRKADLRLAGDKKVSGIHCTITARDQRYTVRDNGSTNGTTLNGREIGSDPVAMKDGDVLSVGRTDLTFNNYQDEKPGLIGRISRLFGR